MLQVDLLYYYIILLQVDLLLYYIVAGWLYIILLQVDFISGPKKAPAEEEIKKRKSRFDSGRPEGTAPTAVAKPVSLVSNISASSLGKTTIDAFGGLNKKLKTW